jgi:histidinol-phosphate aminotransferase
VPYRLAGGRADPDLDAVAAAIDRAVRLVYLSSPANPTGAAIDRAAFERFLARVPDGATIVVDEAYAEYVRRPDALDAIALARATDRPLIALRTFSKLHGLAGLRIAYAVAPPALARALAAAAPPFPVARVAEDAALAALADPEHARAAAARAAGARAALERDLDARGIARLASDAPFVLAAVPGAPGPRFFGSYAMLRIEEEEAPHGTR